ncbi:MAG TPA: efflux RND transporter periplasmic adaptor subunit [Terracidiphilus sp.]|nr:efflux RND transporter periplasmic adaptor subunit [Terracidiphilus sp.]
MQHCSYRILIAFAISAALMAAGCESKTEPATVAASSLPVSSPAPVSPPAPAPAPSNGPDGESFATTGPLVASQQADISAERDGRIVEIAAEIGDRVRAGQLLARLDDRTLQAACDAQKAHMATAQAQVREWQAEEESARASLRRADALHDAKILDDEDWEVAKYKLIETTEQVARYQSEKVEAEANLAATTAQLDQSRIVAPFAGVVGRSSVRPDQQVKAGEPLFWITAQGPLKVLFTVPETLMAAFTAGKPLELTTADYPGLRQAGRIARVSPVVDPASGSIQVIGVLEHASPLLKPGMTMQVRLAP